MFQVIQYFMKSMVRNPPEYLRVLVLMLAVLIYGTTGFLYFELPANPDLSWADGLWYTIVTIATVGYGDFFPKSLGGRFLVGWPIMVFGIGLLGYALSMVAAALVTSKTKEIKGMSTFKLSDHLVIFNFAGLAKVERILLELALDKAVGTSMPVILVDEQLDELPVELQKRGVHYVRGNPTRDETLQRAAIDQAQHAVILTRDPTDPASDNLNVAIALAIEGRCKQVNTVVECIDPASEELLRKAGCDRIVCTSRFDAHFLSQELLNPGVQEVLGDLLSSGQGQQIYLVPVSSVGAFESFSQRCRNKGHMVLGISCPDGKVNLNPPSETPVTAGCRLVTIGPSRLDAL
ncbi:voltage-gated potassium channel [Trichlorobacter thiogenes]|uniref:Voltage-gated potassium channel n=1 Tax=Trichlorobacter thiogenes TaxID=115783 RepID=A0A1T4RG30_9BACT|nr:potassium channel family protein [Trichlorobacter thiogenes]SKA14990.1 voltage-gated potassium channel [Trichlorobacter thiogenes]